MCATETMSSPFAVLDKTRKKQQQQQQPQTAKPTPLSRSNSSLFNSVESFKPTKASLELPPTLLSSTKKENRNIILKKKSTLTSVLRAQSKFSGKSSIVSSKTKIRLKASITKPKITQSNDSSSDRLIRSVPWLTSKSGNVRSNNKLKAINIIDRTDANGRPVKPSIQSQSNSHFQAIDSTFGDVALSEEQQNVLDTILNKRKNVFFTGSAGTGKSFLLKLIIKKLQTRYGNSNIGISAPTGLAASNVGGQTVQRLFGIGLGKEPAEILLNRIKKNMDKYMVWRRMSVLIIDEISMLDSELFDKLNYLAKKIKRNDAPFGGIQVIISGDFLQLPPVNKYSSSSINYCFKSNAWREVIDENIILTKVFRQQGDLELIDILNALRIGNIDYKLESRMSKLSRNLQFDDGIGPTELFPTRDEVERSNLNKLNTLKGPEIVYDCEDVSPLGLKIDDRAKKTLDLLMCASKLKLKEGAQVMLIKNDVDPRLVNGQLGIIEAFITKSVLNSFNARYGQDSNSAAANLHLLKKLSMILMYRRNLIKDKSVEDLALLDSFTAEITKEILKSYNPKDPLLPYVRFTKEGQPPIYLLIEKSEFRADTPGGGNAAGGAQSRNFAGGYDHDGGVVRRQLPIILAWAMSIHKSQGQTLQRVKVDLRKVFEKGQLYVAISRCVSSKGLQVLNFDRRKVFVDEEVISFYKSISK